MTNKRAALKSIFLLSLFFSLFACGGGDDLNDINKGEQPEKIAPQEVIELENYSGDLAIDVISKPVITYNPDDGVTNIVVQFVPRTAPGAFPLTPEQVIVGFKFDDELIGPETHYESTPQELAFNINFGLVLDASYSMIVKNSDSETDAFTPMLSAARTSVQKGVDIWENRAGSFNFKTLWFESFLYYGVDNENHVWSANDITTIPKPVDKTFTKLFAALDFMLEKIALEKQENTQNIVLLFSDGFDNYSHFDNSQSEELDDTPLVTSSGAEYLKLGSTTKTLADVVQRINGMENLTVHVIGLGDESSISVEDLKEISTAGRGLYLENPDNDSILDLFSRVTQEFTTIQSHGLKRSFPSGQHKFTLTVKNKSGQGQTEYSFDFVTGENEVKILE